MAEKSGRGREVPAPTLEELWKRIVAGILTERGKNSHHPIDVGNDGGKRKQSHLWDLG